MAQLSIVVGIFISLLKEYKSIIEQEYNILIRSAYIRGKEIEALLEHLTDLLEVSLAGEEEIEEGNIFLGIDEKLKRAEKSVREGNSEGLFSNLHTIIEILMKDKLGIALNMDDAKLGKVLGICIKYEVFEGKNNILSQLDEKVCKIDNNIKHSGYNPSAKEINDSLLVTTQAIRVLKKEVPKRDDKVIEEISKILIKNN